MPRNRKRFDKKKGVTFSLVFRDDVAGDDDDSNTVPSQRMLVPVLPPGAHLKAQGHEDRERVRRLIDVVEHANKASVVSGDVGPVPADKLNEAGDQGGERVFFDPQRRWKSNTDLLYDFPDDGYDYQKHLRTIGGGTYVGDDRLPEVAGSGTSVRLDEELGQLETVDDTMLSRAWQREKAEMAAVLGEDDEDERKEDGEDGEVEGNESDSDDDAMPGLEPLAEEGKDAAAVDDTGKDEEALAKDAGSADDVDAEDSASTRMPVKLEAPLIEGTLEDDFVLRAEGYVLEEERYGSGSEELDENELLPSDMDGDYSGDDDDDDDDLDESFDQAAYLQALQSAKHEWVKETGKRSVLDDQLDRMLEEEYADEMIGELDMDDPELLNGTIENWQEGDESDGGHGGGQGASGATASQFDDADDDDEDGGVDGASGTSNTTGGFVMVDGRRVPRAVMKMAEELGAAEVLLPSDVRQSDLEVIERNELEPMRDPTERKRVLDMYDRPDDGRSGNAELEQMKVLQRPAKDEQWDCESIISTYTNTDNHPRLIDDVSVRPKRQIRVDRRTGMPMVDDNDDDDNGGGSGGGGGTGSDQYDDDDEDADDDDEDNDDLYEDVVNKGKARPRDETPEERRERKRLIKEERRERRAAKKQTKRAFKAEEKKQKVMDGKVTVRAPGISVRRI